MSDAVVDHMPVTTRGLTYPFGAFVPDHGRVETIAPGIGWLRFVVPGPLGHVNAWLLDDVDDAGPGIAVVDTGLDLPAARDAWVQALDGRRVTRVIVTHFHPDHAGLAGWLAEAHGARIWMTRTEWLMAKLMRADRRDVPPPEMALHQAQSGWTQAQIEVARARGWGAFARMMSDLPFGHVRLCDGDVITIGARDWRVVIGSGHSPEHACLIADSTNDGEAGVMIAGDQVLPRITSNISVSIGEPDADPLGDWLASIDRLRAIPGDPLVLPSHGEPFVGLRTRLDRLEQGHVDSLDRLAERLAQQPLRVVDAFPLLFRRAIDDDMRGLATGEALAHLRHLEINGRARRRLHEGQWWFDAATPDNMTSDPQLGVTRG